MNSLPIDKIADDELLFRAIKPLSLLWDFQNNRPSPSLFHDAKGVSVDRQGSRDSSEILAKYAVKFTSDCGLVQIKAGVCRQLVTYPIPKPNKHNNHHAEIHDSPTQILIEPEKREQLAINVEILKMPKLP